MLNHSTSLREQAKARSLGWSEALRAEPQVPRRSFIQAREAGGSGQAIGDALPRRFAGWNLNNTFDLGFRSQSLAPP